MHRPISFCLRQQIPLEKWGCIACDQFTSDRDYWQKAEAAAAGSPSTLNLILPEVYLEDGDADARIEKIHATMDDYAQNVLTRAVDGFIYVERTEQSGKVRQGLVGMVDLEAYSYRRGEKCTVRPSESTVESRIPPRMKVRTGASLETPHIMMLADDPGCTLIEPVAAHKQELPKVYEGELMLNGGHIAGWAVEDPALIAQIEDALAVLGSQEEFDKKYPDATRRDPLTLAVGDGNHSLATAKACWEELKKTLTPEQAAVHPARWCLAEVCNVHSPAIEIEPIHRVLFNVDCATVLLSLITWSDSNMAGCCFGGSKQQPFTLAGPHMSNVLSFENPTAAADRGHHRRFYCGLYGTPHGGTGGLRPRRACRPRPVQKGCCGLSDATVCQERPVQGRCDGRRAAPQDLQYGPRRGKAVLRGVPENYGISLSVKT